jgi:NitT/TauT family transport system ATP-binding protein
METLNPILKVQSLNFKYSDVEIVKDFSFSVNTREVVVVMGPSGCGKSTLLRLISRIENTNNGNIKFLGKEIDTPPSRIFLGFQDYDAFPWLTVAGNIRITQRFSKQRSNVFDSSKIIASVGLSGNENKYPIQLSGGMRKRLAFGRCLASRAKLILLDEPFSSLDVQSRAEMQCLVNQIVNESECGAIIVTHDVDEAVFLANRILICSGPPLQLRETVNVKTPLQRDNEFRMSPEFEKTAIDIRKKLITRIQ